MVRPGSDGIPSPNEFAGASVEGANDAAFGGDGAIVATGGAGDDEIAVNGGSGRDLIITGIAKFDIGGEIDLAVGAKIGAGLSGGAIEGDEAGVQRADEDSERAGLRRVCGGIAPSGNAAGGYFGSTVGQLELGIELPELGAGSSVQGEYVIVRSAEEENAIDEDRSGFKGSFMVEIFIVTEGAGAERPGNAKLSDVAAID